MNPQRKRRLIIVLLIVLGVSLATALVMMALRENINLYYSPTRIVAGEVAEGQRIRGGGVVVPGSVQRSAEGLDVRFDVSDGKSKVTVQYRGILPDLFREGQGIVVLGKWEGGIIKATEVLAKHDENYMPPEVQNAIDKAHTPEDDASSYGDAASEEKTIEEKTSEQRTPEETPEEAAK